MSAATNASPQKPVFPANRVITEGRDEQVVSAAPADPKPVSAALQRHFDEVLARIPTGLTGQADLAITTQGVEASVGAKKAVRIGTLSGAAYAGREWGGGWLAGGKVSWAFW